MHPQVRDRSPPHTVIIVALGFDTLSEQIVGAEGVDNDNKAAFGCTLILFSDLAFDENGCWR